jgi:hypothetical protein
MALMAGARLGPYEILSHAGAGGMGEVYRGRDTRLQRTVAVTTVQSGSVSRWVPRMQSRALNTAGRR